MLNIALIYILLLFRCVGCQTVWHLHKSGTKSCFMKVQLKTVFLNKLIPIFTRISPTITCVHNKFQVPNLIYYANYFNRISTSKSDSSLFLDSATLAKLQKWKSFQLEQKTRLSEQSSISNGNNKIWVTNSIVRLGEKSRIIWIIYFKEIVKIARTWSLLKINPHHLMPNFIIKWPSFWNAISTHVYDTFVYSIFHSKFFRVRWTAKQN